MKVWKQLLLCVIVLLLAASAWVYFFPGARQVLAGWGMDWAFAAVSSSPQTPAAQQPARPRSGSAVTVVAIPASTATINDRLQAIGTGRANATVVVAPYSSGRVTEFLVESGARIAAGQVIAKLDSDTEEIALERARIARDDAVAKVERARALRKSNAITQVQLTEAELGLRNAELSVHDAQVSFDRRSIIAPITGIVGILPIEAGNYVTPQSSIATIDDRSSILVDFWVPERFTAAITIGADLTATPLANARTSYTGAVSAIDNRIDEKSRTLWVQARIANPGDSLKAGMSFSIAMTFPGDTYPAVSPLAIMWGADGAFVWTVADGKVKRVPVRIVQRNTENVLVEGEIASGDMVVTEGVQSVRQGDDVRVAVAARPQAAASDAAALP